MIDRIQMAFITLAAVVGILAGVIYITKNVPAEVLSIVNLG
jgi:hypothetical protein